VRGKTQIQQLATLNALPLTTSATIKRERLHCRGRLQPTPVSDSYIVRIEYALGTRPEVTVVEPALEIPEGCGLPHVFTEERLCLCYPWQWDTSKLIARTIVPWASEWLLHFEVWKATGEWHGGGHEPDPPATRGSDCG
jgi:hypothetical protein